MRDFRLKVKRIFSDSNLLLPYIILGVLNVVVIGAMGIYGGATSASNKQVEIAKLTAQKESMQIKLSQLKEVDAVYKEALPLLPEFDTIMPLDPALSSYLTTIVLSLAENGFSLKSFNTSLVDSDGVAHIKISAIGDPKKGSDLLAAIESLKRIGNVTNMSLGYLSESATIVCMFDIYYMGEHL